METVALGRDFRCVGDDTVHNHGVNSIRSGRGALLIVDLTNRCNMVCSPCFMEANASTYVHELTMDGVKQILDRAASFKPRREINVAFTGGEATLSPSSSMGMEDGEISFCAYNGGGWRKLVEQNTGRKLGIRSILSVPSHRKKEFIGIIQVSLIRPHAFNVADIGKLRHTGDRLLESI